MERRLSWGPLFAAGVAQFAIPIFTCAAPPAVSAQTVPADHLVINEVLYDPLGTDEGNEWIELYNPTEATIILSGWSIETAGTTFTQTFAWPVDEHAEIASHGFFIIGEENVEQRNSVGNLDLQNGGSATDGIRILNDKQEIVDTLLYDTPNTNMLEDDGSTNPTSFAIDVSEGSSLARREDGIDTNESANDFAESTILTPRQPNAFEKNEEEEIEELTTPTPTPSPKPSPSPSPSPTPAPEGTSATSPKRGTIEHIRKEPKNTWVRITGTVSALPNTISPEFFYIEDGTGGIKIFSSKREFPTLAIGSAVEITGKISESTNETKINVQLQEHININRQNNAPIPSRISTGDLSERWEGRLVELQGPVARKQGTTLYVDDGSGEAKITFAKTTSIILPTLEVGETVMVSGIVGQNEDGYRVLPRMQEDFHESSTTSDADKEQENPTEEKNGQTDSDHLTSVGASITPAVVIALMTTVCAGVAITALKRILRRQNNRL